MDDEKPLVSLPQSGTSSCYRAKYQMTSVAVITGLLLVVWQKINGPLSAIFQISFFAVSLFAFGIQHGALDHLVEAEIARQKHVSFRLTRFLVRYGLLILMYAFCWYLFPQFSFLIFILFSAWHFGETDVSGSVDYTPGAPSKLIFGLSVLGWILFSHTYEADDIISHMVLPQSVVFKVWLTLVHYQKVIVVACGAAMLLISTKHLSQQKDINRIFLLINLSVILGCCYDLPLLPSFALYFAGWHSVIAMCNIGRFIYQSNGNQYPQVHIGKLWLQALPLSLAAIISLIFIGYLLQQYAPLFKPLPLLFVFLSLITLPHMNVMHRLHERLFIKR